MAHMTLLWGRRKYRLFHRIRLFAAGIRTSRTAAEEVSPRGPSRRVACNRVPTRYAALVLAAIATACRQGEAPSPAGPATKAAMDEEQANPKGSPEGGPKPAALPLQRAEAQGQLGPGRGHLLVGLGAPPRAKLTLDAPASAQGRGGMGVSFPEPVRGILGELELPLRIPVVVEDGATGPAEVEISYYWCGEGATATCRRERARLSVHLDLTGDSPGGEAHFAYRAQGD